MSCYGRVYDRENEYVRDDGDGDDDVHVNDRGHDHDRDVRGRMRSGRLY